MFRLSRRAVLFSAFLLSFAFAPQRSEALQVSLPVDFYLEGDASIIPFLPVGTITLTDLGSNEVQFDLDPTLAGLKYDNLGLGLDGSINKFQLVLTPLTPDQMSLDTGGWLGFPFKINFDDKPMTPVSFKLAAPGLDVSDFLHLPASSKYTTTNFALRFWFMTPSVRTSDPIDATAGHDPGSGVPEPASLLLLTGGLLGLGSRRLRRKSA